MSATASAAGASPWVFRLAHYQPVIILTMVATNVTDHVWSPTSVALAALVKLAAIVALLLCVAASVASWRHERALCPMCAGDMPLNASEEAQGRRKRWLRLFHMTADRPVLAAVLVLAVAVSTFWWWGPFAAVWTWWAVEAYAARWHRLLQPWCPWCRHGGRGPRERVVDPTPDPSSPADPKAVLR